MVSEKSRTHMHNETAIRKREDEKKAGRIFEKLMT